MGKNEDMKTILEKLSELENRFSKKKTAGNISDVSKISEIKISDNVSHEVSIKNIGGKLGVNIAKKIGDKYTGGIFIKKDNLKEHIDALQTSLKGMA